MNILIISNSNLNSGSGVIAKDFEKVFQSQGAYVKILVNQFSGESENIINIKSSSNTQIISFFRTFFNNDLIKKTVLKLIRIFSKKLKLSNSFVFKTIHKSKYFVQDIDQTTSIYNSKLLIDKLENFKPDAIIVLFMQNFINFENLFDLKRFYNEIPVYINLLDMAAITGGCHYNWECLGYQKGCNFCPAVPQKMQYKIENNLKFKKDYAIEGDFNFVYCSSYQKKVLEKSLVSCKNRNYKIPLPIDEDYFNNNLILRSQTRKELGFGLNDIVIFFGAMDLSIARKGGLITLDVIKKILVNNELTRVKFLIIGPNFQEFKKVIPEARLVGLNTIHPKLLPNYYNASDLFLSPSIEDAGPMMVNQSIMCGTRVCSFEIGVALDMVKPNPDCGKCATQINPDSLYKAIKEEILFQQKNKRDDLRKKCAESAFNLTSKSAISKIWIKTFSKKNV